MAKKKDESRFLRNSLFVVVCSPYFSLHFSSSHDAMWICAASHFLCISRYVVFSPLLALTSPRRFLKNYLIFKGFSFLMRKTYIFCHCS